MDEKKVEEMLEEIHHKYIMIDFNLRGIITLLEIVEEEYYDGGTETEREWQLFKSIKKLIEIEQQNLKQNNNELDGVIISK